ncbi:MAG: hypothetical protein NXI30_18575 [bacterium]|nr:hypothetical protein [bacterium]
MAQDDARSREADARAQRERARRTWELVISASAEAIAPTQRSALFRVLRVKRFEREAWLARLPGPVRSGARVDLDPLRAALEAADVPCRLTRRARGDGAGEPGGAEPIGAEPPDRV